MGVHHISTQLEVGLSAAPCGAGAPALTLTSSLLKIQKINFGTSNIVKLLCSLLSM